ncbi:MAG: glucosaminidase domain-containing protein [Proteobacteria bacterium]|nr:glucosaminidase domain-containing protein [Pseudomonadota bacterium]
MATQKPLPSRTLTAAVASALFILTMNSAKAAPPIRTNAQNQVPACVTPERLMAFVAERNPHVDARFREIARWYKYYGEGWHVRWDYAFYQMVLETNYLSYRRGDGQRGDVRDTQNNFAGIGATGGGVRGERFPDVKTGVHAQIQHLVAYSGERLAAPVAKRTRDNQDDIIKLAQRLGRPVTFGDLARRWATDRAYGKSIDIVAGLFSARYCNRPSQSAESDLPPPAPLQIRREWRYPFRPPSGLGGPVPDDDDAGSDVPATHAKSKTPSAPAHQAQPVAVAAKKSAVKTPKHVLKQAKVRKLARKPKKTSRVTTAAHTSTSAWVSTTSIVHETDIAKEAAGAAPAVAPAAPAAEQVAENSESSSFLPWLPTFRIAPEPPRPSRLGGPLPAELGAAAKAAENASSPHCKVLTASYGGKKTLLIRSRSGDEVQYTALTIMDGFEKPMFEAYARTEATGAEIVGEYASPESALIDAKVNCPEDH